MNSFFEEKAGSLSGVKLRAIGNIFMINTALWLVDVYLHYYTTPLVELIFRVLHTLIILAWFIRQTPAPFSTRNIIFLLSMFFSVAYPFQADFFRDKEIETYLEIVMPFISNILLIIVFIMERRPVKERRSISEAFTRYFLYVLLPLGYYYFVVYQTIIERPYFILTIVYGLVFIFMMLCGSELGFSKKSQLIIVAGLAVTAFTTGINTYNIFIEKIRFGYAIICFLTMFTPLFFLWGFANEDIIKKARQSD